MSWDTFCVGVLSHPDLAAPLTNTNVDTIWAWSNAETAPYPLLRWNNPMNSTEPWPFARDSGAQPGPHDVKIYATEQDGINATVYTLTREPYYGAICANLRASLSRQQWGATSTAGAELHAWGTGTAWLTAAPYFGPAPIGLGDDMPLDINDPVVQDILTGIQNAYNMAVYANVAAKFIEGEPVPDGKGGTAPNLLVDLLAAVKKIPASSGPDLTGVQASLTALNAKVDLIAAKLAKDLA